MNWSKNRRVLIVDDNPCIHEDFRKILCASVRDPSLGAREAFLFGEPQVAEVSQGFELDSAFQGTEALEMVVRAREEGRPYSMAFVDIRMPPGIDGIETIEKMWPLDSEIQFVICSAYSDHSAVDILMRLGVSDRLLMLRKPCDSAEILLFATAMCEKWNLTHVARTVDPVMHAS